MNTNTKPRAEWMLWEVKAECAAHEDCVGCIFEHSDICKQSGSAFCYPSKWDLTDTPRFTEDEVAAMRVLYARGARYVVQDRVTTRWFAEKPEWHEEINMFAMRTGAKCQYGELPDNFLRALLPGQFIAISDIIGKGDGAV